MGKTMKEESKKGRKTFLMEQKGYLKVTLQQQIDDQFQIISLVLFEKAFQGLGLLGLHLEERVLEELFGLPAVEGVNVECFGNKVLQQIKKI